jgi:hypothetical protein
MSKELPKMQKMLKSALNSQYLQFCRVHCSSMAGSFYANQNLFLLRKVRAIILFERPKAEKDY